MDRLYDIVVTMAAIVVSITVHEFAHAASAVSAGDQTPKLQGRISLNPIDHFDPIGFTMILLTTLTGFGIGWGKPVQINPYNFRHPRWDEVKVSLWGPTSNILMAVVFAMLLRTVGGQMGVGLGYFSLMMVQVNLGLALFNLIPLPPLDGSHILAGVLSVDHARAYGRFAAQYGMVLLLILLVTGGFSMIINPPWQALMHLLLGPKIW